MNANLRQLFGGTTQTQAQGAGEATQEIDAVRQTCWQIVGYGFVGHLIAAQNDVTYYRTIIQNLIFFSVMFPQVWGTLNASGLGELKKTA